MHRANRPESSRREDLPAAAEASDSNVCWTNKCWFNEPWSNECWSNECWSNGCWSNDFGSGGFPVAMRPGRRVIRLLVWRAPSGDTPSARGAVYPAGRERGQSLVIWVAGIVQFARRRRAVPVWISLRQNERIGICKSLTERPLQHRVTAAWH